MNKLSLISIALALITASCAVEKNTSKISSQSNQTFDKEVNQYSAELVARSNNSISSPSNPKKKTDMPAYVITYQIEKDEIKTRQDADTNPTSFAINTGITKMWSDMFCTKELKSIMQKHDVFMITGQLVGKDGKKYSMSPCMR